MLEFINMNSASAEVLVLVGALKVLRCFPY